MRVSLIVKIGIGFIIIFLTLIGIYLILMHTQFMYSDFENDYYTFQTFYSRFNQLFYLQSKYFLDFEENEHNKLKGFLKEITEEFPKLQKTDSYREDDEINMYISFMKDNLDVFVYRFNTILDKIEDFSIQKMRHGVYTLSMQEKEIKDNIYKEVSLWANKAEAVKMDLESIFRVLDREKAKLDNLKLFLNNILLITGVLVSLLISLFILIRFRKTIFHLKRSVTALAEGEGDLTRKISIKSMDEIGMLAEDFNRFIDKIKSIVMKIKSSSEVNMNVKENLFKCAKDVGNVLADISGNSETINNVVNDLDKQISDSITIITNITKNIEELDQQINLQMQSVKKSSESVTSMEHLITEVVEITQGEQKAIHQLVDIIRHGNEKLQKTTSIIDDIAKEVDDLLEMIELINQIVDKTGLLSMNASIEAAHAGDAGKGFAIVAGEIRKLAETTGKNANVISAALKKVIDSIKEASSVYGESSKTFDEIRHGITEIEAAFEKVNMSAARLSEGGNQIKKAMTTLNEISTRVRASSSGMKSGADQITASINSINSMSSTVITMTGDIYNAIHTISVSMDSLSHLSTTLKKTVELLNDEVEKFKT